ncbi:hypothetical protein SPHV1_170006 [Novosphingobium sp. KN65.2]|nr:hypothetical protein SPHV1_170006 [Novosphingobium sp. KN65.2]
MAFDGIATRLGEGFFGLLEFVAVLAHGRQVGTEGAQVQCERRRIEPLASALLADDPRNFGRNHPLHERRQVLVQPFGKCGAQQFAGQRFQRGFARTHDLRRGAGFGKHRQGCQGFAHRGADIVLNQRRFLVILVHIGLQLGGFLQLEDVFEVLVLFFLKLDDAGGGATRAFDLGARAVVARDHLLDRLQDLLDRGFTVLTHRIGPLACLRTKADTRAAESLWPRFAAHA